MPICITSDWGYIGRFSWINSRQSRAVFQFAFDPVPMKFRLQFWGAVSWRREFPPNGQQISVIE